jgi:FG-GAP-like repeat
LFSTTAGVCVRVSDVLRLLPPAFVVLSGVRPAAAAVSAPVLKWANGGCFTSWCQTGWYSSPAVADLDGDGAPEVVWGSYDVVVLNGATGALRARAANGQRVWPGVAVTDLTGDGSLEIVVGRGSNQLHVYRFLAPSTLNVVWSKNPFANNCVGNGCEVRTLAVDDLESDGVRDVIVGRASGGDDRQLNAYDGNGNQRAGWPARRAGELGYGWGMYNENVAVADMNGDGTKEVFGPTDTFYITALDRNGNQLPVNPVYTGRSVWAQVGVHVDHAVDVRGYANCGTEHRPNFGDSAPAVADVNGDGIPELVVIGNVYNCGTDPYTDLYHMPFILKLDRTRWSGNGFNWTSIPPDPGAPGRPLSEDYNVIENAQPNAVVADLDGDSFMEILYASYDGKVHAYWLDKTQHGSWPYTVPGTGGADNFRFAGEPVVADLDNDGQAEVLFTSWPKKATGLRGQLHILSSLGVELYRVNLPPALGGGYNGGLGAPTVANIDADADLEVVMGTVASGVVAFDLPNTAGARVLWGTGRGSYRRTGTPPP